jgi:S-adenosylmethionine-diacylglycerol 3-amino-3-carboxypropyl transferase
VLDGGVVHAGKFEKYFQLFRRRVLPLVHSPRRLEELVRPKEISERFTFYEQTWNTWRWRCVFKLFFSRFVMGRLGRDPEFFRYVEGSVADRILERARYALTELPTHDNPYLDYILFGGYRKALPRYLRPENFDKVRQNLEKLRTFEGTIEQAAEKYGDDGFDGFNLSDIFEYLDLAHCERIFCTLRDRSRMGARFAYWNMLLPRQRPESLSERIKSADELAQELFAQDRAFFYSRFIVEEAC